jgi:hypothetical protein
MGGRSTPIHVGVSALAHTGADAVVSPSPTAGCRTRSAVEAGLDILLAPV